MQHDHQRERQERDEVEPAEVANRAPDFARIGAAAAADVLAGKHVVGVGAGAAVDLYVHLARCGLGKLTLLDMDVVERVNLPRQGYYGSDLGKNKAVAAAARIAAANCRTRVRPLPLDVTTLSDAELREQFADADLFVGATDNHPAQAAVNRAALLLRKPAVFLGMHQGGGGGEIVLTRPELPSCFRCVAPQRYAKAPGAAGATSHGSTILDTAALDSVGGVLIVGLLTLGTDTRYAKIVEALGDRQVLLMRLDGTSSRPDHARRLLQVPAECDAYFGWNVAALRDPDGGNLHCPDCERYAGVRWENGVRVRP